MDTSVWIRFLANRPPHALALDSLLDRGEVLAHDLVYGELLIGDRSGRLWILDPYPLLNAAHPVPHSEVVDFVKHHKLHGQGAGWIDIHLLASAVAGGHKLWTADPRLNALAKRFGVAYELR